MSGSLTYLNSTFADLEGQKVPDNVWTNFVILTTVYLTALEQFSATLDTTKKRIKRQATSIVCS